MIEPANVGQADPAVQKGRFSRRRLLKRGFAAAAGAVVGVPAYAALIEPHWIQITHVSMPVRHLPDELHGRRLIQISDLHVGPMVDTDYLRSVIERVSELEPDILAITGDFIHHIRNASEQITETGSLLKDLARPRFGTVTITGNHDYGERWNHRSVADRLTDRLEAVGIRMLRNAVMNIQGLQIAGVDDLWSPDFQLDPIQQLDPDAASIVLCHNPDAVDLDGWGDYRGWVLAGHTHGGQCRVPLYGAPILPVQNRSYVAGIVEAPGGRTLYINRGIGYLRRIRFLVRPEITVFELQPAALQ